MKTNSTLICILTASLCSAPVVAEKTAAKINMMPGLWEHRFTMSSQNGEMEAAMKEAQKQLANMPADQRKLLEDLMAAQGVNVSMKGDSTQVKACITQDVIDSGELPQAGEDCSQNIVEQTKGTYKITFNCAGNPPSSGAGEVVFSSPKAYTGKSTYTTVVNGKKEDMTMIQSGKWLAADCGTIKPHTASKSD